MPTQTASAQRHTERTHPHSRVVPMIAHVMLPMIISDPAAPNAPSAFKVWTMCVDEFLARWNAIDANGDIRNSRSRRPWVLRSIRKRIGMRHYGSETWVHYAVSYVIVVTRPIPDDPINTAGIPTYRHKISHECHVLTKIMSCKSKLHALAKQTHTHART